MTQRTIILSAHAPDHVQRHLVSLNRRAGTRFSRPTQPLSGLARAHLESRGVTVASPMLAHRLLAMAVKAEFGAHAPSAAARSYGPAVRELLRVEANLDVFTLDAAPRVRSVAAVARTYQALLRAHGAVDGAEVLAVAAHTLPPIGPLTLYGYVRLTMDELRLLNAAAGDGSEAYLPWATHDVFEENEQAAAWLAAHGWQVQRDERPAAGFAAAFLDATAPRSTGRARTCAHAEEEIRHALADVKQLLISGVPPRDIGLVVEDDATWGPLVQAVAWEYDLPVEVTASRPLEQTRVGAWVQRALDVVEGGATFERAARLLGHPLDVGITAREWGAVRRARPQDAEGWSNLGVDLQAFAWPEHDSRPAWVARFTALLEQRLTARLPSLDALEAEAWRLLQAELTVLAAPAEEELTRDEFTDELRGMLALLAVAPQACGEAVELLTPYAVIGASLPHVLVLGLAEGAWPPPLHDDAVLDFLERKRLRVEGVPVEVPGSLARRDMLSFWSLLGAASGTLTVSYARISGKGDEVLPSAYLTRLDLPSQEQPPLRACSVEEARQAWLQREHDEETLKHARRAFRVEREREASPHFDEYDGLTGIPVNALEHVFSANQLRTLGSCAFRWWLTNLLRVDLEEDDDDVLGLGNLQHAALKHAANRALEQPERDAREVMLEALDDSLTRAEHELHWPQTGWRAERLEVLTRLERFVRAPAFLPPGAAIAATERSFEGEWQGLRVRGQVDRVDRLGDKLLIVDYKSGTSKPWGAQDTEGKLTLDLQLPIYVEAALPALYPGAKSAGAHYLSIKTGEVLSRVTLNAAAFEEFTQRARQALEEGRFVPQPDVQGKACTRCPFPPVCRQGPRLDRKERP